ncbi:unnamed protein product [Sphagnum compactum]
MCKTEHRPVSKRPPGLPRSRSNPVLPDYSGSFTNLMGSSPPPPTEAKKEGTETKIPSESKTAAANAALQRLNSSANVQLALYIAMAHAGLAIAILVLFGIGVLLRDYWKPIQWAVLISMPLRELQGALVSFWEEPLQKGLLQSIMATPVAMFKAVVGTASDLHNAVLGMISKRDTPPNKVGFAKIFLWLLSFAICTIGYDLLGPVVLASTALVGLLLYAASTSLVPALLEMCPILSSSSDEKQNKFSTIAVTRSLVASLPRVVAIWLILAMIMGSLGGAVILSYKVGMETKDAIVIMKTHVQSNNYAEKIGLSQWIEENNVSQQIDAYWVQAYDTLMQQVDVFVEKNNLTEAAEVGKEFLRGGSRKLTVIGAENETEAAALDIPSHPLVERLQDIKAKLQSYDFGGAYIELEAAMGLALQLLQIGKEDFFEKAKQTLQKSSEVGKTVLVSGTNLMGRGFYFMLFLWNSLASGAAGVINFFAQSVIFFSVLYYLITSESGGVMNQILNMVPLSDQIRSRCATVLDHAVSSVLLATLKTAFFQATFTWLFFRWFRIHFVYTSTLLALVQSVLPLFPNWVASLPAGAQLALEGRYVMALILMLTHVYLMEYGLAKIHEEIPGHNEYITGLSIAGGMALFSPALEGAIMGPLIMTVLFAAKNLYAEFVLGTK